MQIRKMYETDIPAILVHELEIFPEPWSKVAFLDSLDFSGGGGFVVAHENGEKPKDGSEIVGYACYYSVAGETHLTNIAVAESYRRKKVANRLLEAIFAEAKAASSEAVFLEVRESSVGAQKLYANHGFTELYRRRRYYSKPTEDAIVLIKELPENVQDASKN